jgi:hypothetical protein
MKIIKSKPKVITCGSLFLQEMRVIKHRIGERLASSGLTGRFLPCFPVTLIITGHG